MRTHTRLLAGLTLSTLVLAGCPGTTDTTDSAAAPEASAPNAAAPAAAPATTFDAARLDAILAAQPEETRARATLPATPLRLWNFLALRQA